jgi:hypothetical protein
MTHTSLALRVIALAAGLALVACSDESGSPSSTSSTSSAGSGGSGGDPGPRLVSLSATFVDARTQAPLSGLDVCTAERDDVPCGKTDAQGRIEIAVPADAEILLACTIETHVPTYMTLKTPSDAFDVGVFRLLDASLAETFVSLAGASQERDHGIVIANVYEDIVVRDVRVADATFSLSPEGGLGPIYGGPIGLPDPSLDATTAGGPAAFFELSEGERTLSIEHATRRCVGGFGWPAGGDSSLRTKVVAGGMSTVTFVCPP